MTECHAVAYEKGNRTVCFAMRIGDEHFCNLCRGRNPSLQQQGGIEIAESLIGSEIQDTVCPFCHTGRIEIAQRQIVFINIIVEAACPVKQTTDTFVGTYPDVAFVVFDDRPDIDIIEVAVPSVYCIFPSVDRGEAYQSLGRSHPHTSPVVADNLIDGVGGETVGCGKLFDSSVVGCKDTETVAESTYPDTSVLVFRYGAHLVIGYLVMRQYFAGIDICDKNTGTGAYRYGTIIVFIEISDIDIGSGGEYRLQQLAIGCVHISAAVETTEPQLTFAVAEGCLHKATYLMVYMADALLVPVEHIHAVTVSPCP